jgi:uncharacterized protein (DUF1800 family)
MLEPISRGDWNKYTAAHLFSRAGFDATTAEIEAAARRAPEEVVAELVDFEKIADKFDDPEWAKGPEAAIRPDRNKAKLRGLSEMERKKKIQEAQQIQRERIGELRGWWLYRMRYSKRQLQEKLALFWHGHWASSAEKVKSAYALWLQNSTLRKFAAGNFKDMTVAISQDPAMLFYLDNAQSRAQHPNENYARELMELFTLGIGNYTEDDIKNSARAFTGWSIDDEKIAFKERAFMHDDGEKTFMGRKGKFTANDIINIIFEQPACAPYITRKLWSFFAYENPPAELVNQLASSFRDAKWEMKPLLKKIFLSKEFYSKAAMRTQIKSPVQWLVGTARTLDAPLPNADVCAGILHLLGQDLFAPPSVKGWDGGYAWITTNSLLSRYNFAGILVKGGDLIAHDAPGLVEMARRSKGGGDKMAGPMGRVMREIAKSEPLFDCKKILPPEARKDKQTALAALEWELFHANLSDNDNKELRESLDKLPEPSKWTDGEIRSLLHTMMSTPFYQLT